MENGKFVYWPMPLFSKKLEEIRHSDPPGYSRIHRIIERLLEDPANSDGKMKGLYNGRLKKYVGRKDYRLIYYWCRMCHKETRRLERKCDGCNHPPENSVIFFDLYHKNDKSNLKELD